MNENKHNIEKSKTDKSRCFQCPSPFGRRLTVMVTGLFALGFGISILRSINMGLDPCSCLTQGVSNLTHLSFGTCQVLCNFLMFLVVLKFDISRLGWGTVGNMVFLGYISDFFIWLYKVLLPVDFFNSLVVRWFFLIPGLVCLLLVLLLFLRFRFLALLIDFYCLFLVLLGLLVLLVLSLLLLFLLLHLL